MKVAVLPLNAAEGTAPALGRQFANFCCDLVRANTGAEVNAVSYLTQIDDNGQVRAAFVNVADTLLEQDWISQMFAQSEVDVIMDGLLKLADGQFEMTVRIHDKEGSEPKSVETWSFGMPELFQYLHRMVKLLAAQTGLPLQNGIEEKLDFGTDDPSAFVKFLEGYDTLIYIQQANGQVTRDFTPEAAIGLLLDAVKADIDFVAPSDTLIQLCRMCANYRLGTFDLLKNALEELAKLIPDDYKPAFALGEIHAGIGDQASAAEYYEQAISLEENESALYTRLGMAQLAMGMPVNAERNFRKAWDMEGEDKPTTDLLATVLMQTNRGHEVSTLWKSVIDQAEQNAGAHAKYAMALIQSGQTDAGEKAFEHALEILDDNLVVKRFYAPYLVQKQDFDRAMDFYEDCIDATPQDVETLLEYARTLQIAGREFEVPRVLQDVLTHTTDRNVRAQTLAWLIELEQPKRVESVESARQKMEAGDFETAAKELKPLRNWLADYWKLWAMLASAQNNLESFEEAEEAARKLLELFPACEPGYGELVTALNGQGKNEEAYSLMRFAASNMPQSLPVHLNLALAAKRAGHGDEAKSLAKQIREAVGPNPDLEPILVEIEG